MTVGIGDSGSHVGDFQTMSFGLGDGSGALAQADGDVDTGVLQVARLCVALGAVADHGDFLAPMMERSQSLS